MYITRSYVIMFHPGNLTSVAEIYKSFYPSICQSIYLSAHKVSLGDLYPCVVLWVGENAYPVGVKIFWLLISMKHKWVWVRQCRELALPNSNQSKAFSCPFQKKNYRAKDSSSGQNLKWGSHSQIRGIGFKWCDIRNLHRCYAYEKHTGTFDERPCRLWRAISGERWTGECKTLKAWNPGNTETLPLEYKEPWGLSILSFLSASINQWQMKALIKVRGHAEQNKKQWQSVFRLNKAMSSLRCAPFSLQGEMNLFERLPF